MIYEYALEPSLVVDWAVAGIGRCVGQFGLDCRRLVSDFPRDWKGRVIGEFYERFEYDDTSVEFQNAQPELETYLQILTDCMVPRQIDIPLTSSWLKAALAEHRERPFYAIFAAHEPEEPSPAVITEAVIDHVRDKRWYLPTIKTARKSAAEIAVALRPVLQMATRIALVDPYFNAKKKRYLESLAAIVVQALKVPRSVDMLPEITVITGVEQAHDERDGPFTPEQIANVSTDLRVNAELHIPKCIPRGFQIRFEILRNRAGGDPLHNRFLLTDVGGVIIPYGLDDYTRTAEHSPRDDLTPMLRGMYEERWKQYMEPAEADVVLGPIPIIG